MWDLGGAPITDEFLYKLRFFFFFLVQNVVRNLVQRYLTRRQKRGGEHYGVTEDDINELKQEISTFRCDLYEILRNYGMKTNPIIDRKACKSRVSKYGL